MSSDTSLNSPFWIASSGLKLLSIFAAHPKSGGQYPGQHGLSDNGSGGTERGDLYNQPDESKPEIPSGNGNAVKVRRKCYRSLRQRCYDEIYKNTQKRVYSKCRITKSFLGWGTIDAQ